MEVVRVVGLPDEPTLARARACVGGGGTLIFPTETVYGIGCDPENADAVRALFRAKGRAPDKPLAIHVARPIDAEAFAGTLRDSARRIMRAFWPGPLAIIVERAPTRAAAAALGGATISLRCPDDDACRAILAACGPLGATSANLSGLPSFTGEAADAIAALPDATLAIITGPTRLRQESTVVDCTGPSPRILRIGAIPAAAIDAAS